MVIVAVDYGDRYVGLAKTDADGRITLREGMIDQKKEEAVAVLRSLVAREKAGKVLVGVPRNFSGEATAQTERTMGFIKEMRAALGSKITVEEVDELFTSKEARRVLTAEGGKPEEEHAEAARLMLEQYLRGVL